MYREQSQGQKIQRRGHQVNVKDFKVAGEFVLFKSSNWLAGYSIHRVKVWTRINI